MAGDWQPLDAGQHLILTPGVYNLTNSILVTNADTVILGLGYATLVSGNGKAAMVIADVNGVKVAGIIFDAGSDSSPSLLEVGTASGGLNHATDPICLYDICSRVGGATAGPTATCVTHLSWPGPFFASVRSISSIKADRSALQYWLSETGR